MEPVPPHASTAREYAIDGFGDAIREPLIAACEPRRGVGLDQEVNVIALRAEVDDPEPVARRCGQRAANGDEDARAAE